MQMAPLLDGGENIEHHVAWDQHPQHGSSPSMQDALCTLSANMCVASIRARAKAHACDLHKLVCVIGTIEERFLPEHHARQRAPQAPQIQAVVVVLQVH